MPHKHKRRQIDEATYDLPPSVVAKPLPVREQKAKNKKQKQKQGKQSEEKKPQTASLHVRQKHALEDDTPRAFRRLMQFQTPGGRRETKDQVLEKNSNNKKRKRDATTAGKDEPNKKAAATKSQGSSEPQQEQQAAVPKILPGEKLSDFAARVDHALPLSGMNKSNKPTGQGKIREDRQTRHEKHLRRLQQGWREEEARIREREEAEREEREDEMEDQLRLWKEWEVEAGSGKAKKKAAAAAKKKTKNKGKGRAGTGDVDRDDDEEDEGDDDPDPWAKLKKRDRARQANPMDVVQGPPQLTKPREIFKVRGGARVDVANVPAAVGSLRRREELAGERRSIVEEYRRLMAEKRQ